MLVTQPGMSSKQEYLILPQRACLVGGRIVAGKVITFFVELKPTTNI